MTLIVQKLLLWNSMLFKTILPSIHWSENGGHNTIERLRNKKKDQKMMSWLSVFNVCSSSFKLSWPITEIWKENHAALRFVNIVNHSLCYVQSHLTRLIWARSRITLIIWDSSSLRCKRATCRLGHLYTPGAFQKSELAGRTMVGPDILAIKWALSKRFCWKTISFVHNI